MGTAWSDHVQWDNVSSLLNEPKDFDAFAEKLDRGVHAGGHFTIGGLQYDQFTSPGDPAFYFHHTQVDRMWTLWQNLDIETRGKEISGPSVWFDSAFFAPVAERHC